MPIIEHSSVRMPAPVDYRAERTFVSAEQGAAGLTIKEVELHPGWEGPAAHPLHRPGHHGPGRGGAVDYRR